MAYNNRCSIQVALIEHGHAIDTIATANQALDDCTGAIRLDPTLAIAYFNRGSAYSRKEDYVQAIWDYSQAFRLNKEDLDFLGARGDAYFANGDLDLAAVDYTEVIERDPKQTRIYADRGLVNYLRGDFAASAFDLDRVRERVSSRPHLLLWLLLAQSRSGYGNQKPGFGATVEPAQLDKDKWPYPVIELFIGPRPEPEATLAAAKSLEERCEALFYIGQWQLIRGERAAAINSLQAATKDPCPNNSMEFLGAEIELRQLLNVSSSSGDAGSARQ